MVCAVQPSSAHECDNSSSKHEYNDSECEGNSDSDSNSDTRSNNDIDNESDIELHNGSHNRTNNVNSKSHYNDCDKA